MSGASNQGASILEIKFADLAPGEEVIALGLPAGRLGLLGAGLATTAGILNLPWPEPFRLAAGMLLAVVVAALVWLRLEELTLAGWVRRSIRLWWRRWAARRVSTGVWAAVDPVTHAGNYPRQPPGGHPDKHHLAD